MLKNIKIVFTGGQKIDINDLRIDERVKKYKILVTGAAGFIGSNLLEFFLEKSFKVTGLDNFITGSQQNIDAVIKKINDKGTKPEFNLIKGDIRDYSDCIKATRDIDIVYHEAALGSVQRSIDKPIDSNEVNVTGTLNLLKASLENNINRFIFASSSSVYGDSDRLPKTENMITEPKSVYAVSKLASEYYVRLFFNIYGLKTISLRYFNVFGKNQNPDSIYSAVIPIFLKNIEEDKLLIVFGDGRQNRDFTFIDNVVYANYLAMVSDNKSIFGNFYNVGSNKNISLNDIIKFLEKKKGKKIDVVYKDPRKGDVRSSLASLAKIKKDINYKPIVSFFEGLESLIR